MRRFTLFCERPTLTPSDPLPLTFLGKACDEASPDLATRIRSRIQSFITHDAQSAELNYYLAVCLSKGNQIESKPPRRQPSRMRFLRARHQALDPNYADAYFQLGNLYAEQHKIRGRHWQYEQAIGSKCKFGKYSLPARTSSGTDWQVQSCTRGVCDFRPTPQERV